MQETIAPPERLNYSTEEIAALYEAQQHFFRQGFTKPYAFRKGQLNVLKAVIKRNEQAILEALKQDLGKSGFEAYATEIGIVYEEINHAQKNLRMWIQPARVPTPLTFFPSSSKVYNDPLGMVLIMSPWNYPINLIMAPLIAAIAAGNTVLLKPSELAPATEAVITKIINETYEPEYIAIVSGPGQLVVSELIEKYHLDHIFFTGSTAIGKKIMAAAAQQLSPVTLELGGKSPCIVASDAKLEYAAKKIAWSKWINAGQTCVAPDYLLLHESIKEKFIAKLVAQTEKMFGKNAQQSTDYPRIINDKRWQTLNGYLQEGNIIFGGKTDQDDKYISPTIIENVTAENKLMRDEIFGPILPIITYKNNEEVLEWINKNPYPLAFYLFTESKSNESYFLDKVRFGGGCINNGLIHLGNPNLPFGGVGFSGVGQYHGKDGFDTFTHKKSILKSPCWFDLPVWYAPFKDKIKLLKKLMK
jgi:aldehyde dehydrogenase (NAD+)